MRKKGNQKRHIAMIGHKRVPSREGGVEVVVWELAKRLHARGYDVDCYNRHDPCVDPKREYVHRHGRRGWYRNGIRLITIPTVRASGLNAIIYSALATMRALFARYDVIHYHAEGPCLMCRIPRLFGVRVIATIHGLDWQRSKWGGFATRMLKQGEKTAALYADEVIVLSRSMQQYFLDTYGRRTRYIPNGINDPKKLPPSRITELYGLKGGDYLFTLSRIVPEKGIHYLLEAFRDTDTDMKLVIAGGSGNSEAYRARIKRMAAEDDRVILTDFIHDELLTEVCSNAYLFVLPSDVEGMSVSLLEAMSYGNACLVSDIPENMEVVGDSAEHFAAGDVEELQEKLTALLESPERVRALGEAAREHVLKTHDWDAMTTATVRLYEGAGRTRRGNKKTRGQRNEA